jgi:MscS family membrane protein
MMNFEQLFANLPVLSDHLLLQQVTVILVYSFLAKMADLFIDRIVRRVAERTEISYDNHIIGIVHWPICWTIFLLGILHALLLRSLPEPYQSVLPAAAKSIILVLWLFASIRIFNHFAAVRLTMILERGKIGSDLFLLLKNIIRVVLVIVGMFWFLSLWQVNLTPLFASAGIVGIAVALAAKDTLANFFGGISIFADNTFKVGDYVIVDNLQRGEVVEIGIRSTRLKTRDDVLITIPNSILANSKIINESAPIPRYRIRIPVGVAYSSDLDLVEATLMEIVLANPQVVTDPEPRVRYRSFGDSAINLELLLWLEEPSLKGRETHRLLKAIHRAFAAKGIIIPFPQRDLHIKGLTATGELLPIEQLKSKLPMN